MRAHEWEFEAADAETVTTKKGEKRETGMLTLHWRCARCGGRCTTKTGTATITMPRPADAHAQAAGVDPNCDQATVDLVHDL